MQEFDEMTKAYDEFIDEANMLIAKQRIKAGSDLPELLLMMRNDFKQATKQLDTCLTMLAHWTDELDLIIYQNGFDKENKNDKEE